MAALNIAAFGGTIAAPIGTTVFLDDGQDAVLTADSRLSILSVRVVGASDHVQQIGVQRRSDVEVSFSTGPLFDVIVDNIKIGEASGVGAHHVTFYFNASATAGSVQKLIQALTYTKISGDAAEQSRIELSLTDIDGQEMTAAVAVDLIANAAPSDIALNRFEIKELSKAGAWIGDLSAVDTPGNTFTFQLIDDAGGRFRVEGSQLKVNKGTLLDYEQSTSHAIRVRVTDQGGLSFEKSFTIDVRDEGREIAVGTAAHEIFVGGSGADKLDGGYGNDRLTGGKGKDTFIFKSTLNKTKNVDTITDFNRRDDTIQLENKIFKKLTKTGTLWKDFFTVGPKAKDHDDYIVYDRKKGYLYYDADGSGTGKAILFAKLKATIDHKDFFVI